MADEKKGGKANEALAQHFDKIILAVAALALVAYLVLGVAMAAPDPVYGKLRGNVQKQTSELRKAHPDKQAPPAPKYVPGSIDPWNEVATARAAGNWAGALLPMAEGEALIVKVARKKKVWVPEIAFQGAEVALDGVTINWSVGPTIDKKTADKEYLNPVELSSFKLERAAGDGAKWEVLADNLAIDTTSYVDKKIDPRTKYSYRVTARCDAPEYLAEKKSNVVMTVGTAQPIVTQGIWELSFITPMQKDGKGMVYMEINKFDKEHGKVKIRHMQAAGEKIGWWKEGAAGDGEPVSTHPTHVGFRSVPIDFNTGMVLKSVKPVKKTVKQQRCKEIVGPNGYERCDTVYKENTISTNEIVYTDEVGKTQTAYLPALETHPLAQPQLCARHDPNRKSTGEVAGNTPATGEPKESTAKREVKAKMLLQLAQRYEVRKNNTEAAKAYQRLVDEYGDTKEVKSILPDIKRRIFELKK